MGLLLFLEDATLDNGWAASADWETRRGAAERLVASAAEEGRPVLLAATAEGPDQPLVTQDARSVLERLRAMEPRPWPTTRGELTIALRKAAATRAPGATTTGSPTRNGAEPR